MPDFLAFLCVYHLAFFFFLLLGPTHFVHCPVSSACLQPKMFSNEDVTSMRLLFIAALSAFVFLRFYSHIPEAVLKQSCRQLLVLTCLLPAVYTFF